MGFIVNSYRFTVAPFEASGGTESEAGGYKYHTFNSNGTFTISSGAADLEYLLVAGGGGGGTAGSGGNNAAGGGGAGGSLEGT